MSKNPLDDMPPLPTPAEQLRSALYRLRETHREIYRLTGLQATIAVETDDQNLYIHLVSTATPHMRMDPYAPKHEIADRIEVRWTPEGGADAARAAAEAFIKFGPVPE